MPFAEKRWAGDVWQTPLAARSLLSGTHGPTGNMGTPSVTSPVAVAA